MGAVPAGFSADQPLDVSALGKAELVTQGQDDAEGAALLLKGKCTLVGTARSAGSADVGESEIRGEVIPNSPKEALPVIPLAELSTAGDIQTLPRGTYEELEKVSGQLTFTGPTLHFKKGLQLNGATLRVRGNLVIDGPVTGIGALIVEGNVILRGGSALSADNQCAIVSTGGVSVTGSGQEGSYFQGLIYASGSRGVQLTDCTVVGTVLNTGEVSPGVGAPMQVDRATVAFAPQSVSQTVELSATGVDDGTKFSRARLKKALPLASFFRDGAWDVPSNVRPAATADNPLALSPLERVLVASLEIQIDGKWYATVEEALSAGVSENSVQSALGRASVAYFRQLSAASQMAPSKNSGLSFEFDLNKYLQTSGRLRVVCVQSI